MSEPGRGRRGRRRAGATPPPDAPPSPVAESELGYGALLEQASDAIFVTDGDFRILYANARACEMLGFGLDELKRMNAADVPTTAEIAAHPLERERLRQGRPVTTHRRLRRKDGTSFNAETNATLLGDGRIMAIVRDITERQRTERRLAESEARYSAVVEQAAVGSTGADGDGRFVEANPRACEILGRSREALLGRPVFDLVAPGEPRLTAEDAETLRTGGVLHGVRHLLRPDGTERIVEVSARSLRGGQVVSILNDVTDRVEAERRLAESEARYGAVVTHATAGITVTDEAWRFVEVNPRACDIFGYSREELLRMTVHEIAAPGELEDAPLHAEALKTGRDSFSTRRVRRPDGTERIVEISGRGLADGRVVSVVNDVTDRVEAERRLAESEARYAAVVENATVGITDTDAQWRFVEVNPRACEIFGYSREELLGRQVFELSGPADPGIGAAEMATLRDGGVVRGVRHLLRHDGTRRTVEISARGLGGEQVVSIIDDITERIEAERRLAQSEAHLVRAQELAHFGTWEAVLESYTGLWSPEMYRIYGIPPDRVPVTYDMFAEGQHPDDRGRVEQRIGEVMAGGPAPRTYEHRVLRSDGSVRILHATVGAQRNAEGRVVRLVGSSQDITEQRLLEAQLREAQKLEAIGRLAGGVAHDFNNLLTVILRFVETMLDGMPEGDRQRGGAEQIRLAARRAAGLTQQLLAFGRRQMFRLEVFDLNEVLGEMREILRRLIGEQIEITISPGARVATIKADRGQIEQVVLNLALNARDAMPAGGRLAIATANVDPPEGWPAGAAAAPCLVLTVTDTGIGMSPELQAHIFEPFYTTKDVGQGTGLGLATVHGIVSQTGGRIEVRSAPGQGTRFLVHLPCAVDEAAPAPGPPAAPLGGGDETVLVVEDDAAVRSLVAEVLRRRGYHVLEAVEGEEAVDLVGRHAGPLHLLITDVVMPGMGGQDLARRLLGVRPGLRVLLISGYSGERGDPVGPLAGTMAFLQKPFSPGALVAKVREVLDLPAGAQGGA